MLEGEHDLFYQIAGVTLCSQIALPSFRDFVCAPRKADVTLTIEKETPPAGSEEIQCEFFVVRRLQEGWYFYVQGEGHSGLLVSRDYTCLRFVQGEEDVSAYEAEWYLRIALECLMIHRGYVSLHGACIELDDEAIAFSGPSGVGKSTRAVTWMHTFGAKLINGDRPLIHVMDQEVYGVPWDGKEQCFRNVHRPLSVICEVRRSSTVSVRKLSFRQSRQLLVSQCFMPMWDSDTAFVQFMNITRLASRARIVRVFCGPEAEDARKVRQILEDHQEEKEASDMKAKGGFVLRHIMDEYILMPTGENISKFKGTILLNEVSAFLWEKLQKPVSREDLLTALLDEYEVDPETAGRDLDATLEKFRSFSVIEDE